MRNVSAVFRKQIKETLKNKTILNQFFFVSSFNAHYGKYCQN